MSTYESTCPKCGDTYRTEGWEPTKCPFCELAEFQRTEPLKLAERNGLLAENTRLREILELIRDHGGCTTTGEGLICTGYWCAEQARRTLEEAK